MGEAADSGKHAISVEGCMKVVPRSVVSMGGGVGGGAEKSQKPGPGLNKLREGLRAGFKNRSNFVSLLVFTF